MKLHSEKVTLKTGKLAKKKRVVHLRNGQPKGNIIRLETPIHGIVIRIMKKRKKNQGTKIPKWKTKEGGKKLHREKEEIKSLNENEMSPTTVGTKVGKERLAVGHRRTKKKMKRRMIEVTMMIIEMDIVVPPWKTTKRFQEMFHLAARNLIRNKKEKI